MPIEVIPRRGFPHQPLTAKPHTRLSDPGAKSQPEDGPTLGRAFARFSRRHQQQRQQQQPSQGWLGSVHDASFRPSFSPSPWKLITVHRKIGQMVRLLCQHFVRVHGQNSSHVAAAAEPLTANENVVQGAHRNTPRASLCAVKSTLSLSLSLFRLPHADQLPPALFACPRNSGPNWH
jgi:hypothetical protein